MGDPIVTSYRHQLVNSCRNLKAFDHHVVSDEEIIEHFKIPECVPKFKTKSKHLRINLCPDHDNSLFEGDDAMNSYNQVQDILAKIDYKIKHGSPVQIIQRYIRGWITRKIIRGVLYLENKEKSGFIEDDSKRSGNENAETINPAPSEYSNELEIETLPTNLLIQPKFKIPGARPPTSSRIPSARNIRPSTKILLKTCEKLENENLPYYELNVLKKRSDKKYHSFYLKSEEETRNWIKEENQNIDIDFDQLKINRKIVQKENTQNNIRGAHISAQEFDSHAEKLESIHTAKVHRAQLEDLIIYK